MFLLLIVLTALLLSGCVVETPAALTPQPTPAPTIRIANPENISTEEVGLFSSSSTEAQFTKGTLTLIVSKPETWDAINTANGIVVSERFASVETAGVQERLMAHTFFSRVENLSTNVSGTEHPAQTLLEVVSANAATRRIANRTEVTSFEWDGYDAAYYVLSDADNEVAYVVSVMLPELGENGVMLSSIISAPYDERSSVIEMLPTLIDNVRINGVHLSNQPFDTITARIEFPPTPDASLIQAIQATMTAQATVEVTVEATSELTTEPTVDATAQ